MARRKASKESGKKKSSKPKASRTKKEESKKVLTIAAAKGRPMLQWFGKKPLRQVTAFAAQHIESFAPTSPQSLPAGEAGDMRNDWPSSYPKGGLLFHGDNKEVLAHLLEMGSEAR